MQKSASANFENPTSDTPLNHTHAYQIICIYIKLATCYVKYLNPYTTTLIH